MLLLMETSYTLSQTSESSNIFNNERVSDNNIISSSTEDEPLNCKNSVSFQFEGNPDKTCDLYVTKTPTRKRYTTLVDSKFSFVSSQKENLYAKRIQFYCPLSCKKKCKNNINNKSLSSNSDAAADGNIIYVRKYLIKINHLSLLDININININI
jgi:hypothetical protein